MCFFHFPLATCVKNRKKKKKKNLPCVGLEPGEKGARRRADEHATLLAPCFYAAILGINTTYRKLTAQPEVILKVSKRLPFT